MARGLLFLTKRRGGYWGVGRSSGTGLWNSARFVVDMLVAAGIRAKLVEVGDNNDIDREVTAYGPTHCVIEAFWVTPEKFDVLKRLHPKVHWIVRDHSETPFLAQEGTPFAWVVPLLERGVEVMCNARRAQVDMQLVAHGAGTDSTRVGYGPNFYPLSPAPRVPCCSGLNHIDIGCFGAIRPLKNHMVQAIAAMEFARRVGRTLRFHINANRVEGNAEPVLRAMRAVLGRRLVEHEWMSHDEFVPLVATMDMSLQVSFSETFNIVAADSVQANVPTIVSPEISWLGAYAHADPTWSISIVEAMERVWLNSVRERAHRQRADLASWNAKARSIWVNRFGA